MLCWCTSLQQFLSHEVYAVLALKSVEKSVRGQKKEVVRCTVECRDSDLGLAAHEVLQSPTGFTLLTPHIYLFAFKVTKGASDGQTPKHTTEHDITTLTLNTLLLIFS